MTKNLKRTEFFVWGLLSLVIIGIVVAFIRSKMVPPPQPPPVYNQVSDFSLTNQHNSPVSLADLRGKIWIADVIFTRCPLQCIRMTKRMRQLQEALPRTDSVQLVSLTADPDFDTPEVLKSYGQQVGAEQGSWWFLTGARSEISRLSVEGLKLVVYEKKPEEREVPADLFLHSTKFVLVDAKGQVRGWFDGESDETKGKLLSAVKALLREQKK